MDALDVSMLLPFVWLLLVFVLGASIGSFLNVCVHRIPFYERSIFWPSSRCGQCLQPIRWYDNLPLLSYWLLRGRCRKCGARFSIRYFLVELFTGLAFAGLFYLEIMANVHDLAIFKIGEEAWQLRMGLIPPVAWVIFGYHAVLLSFLIVVSLSDIDHLEIPLSITVTGMVVGLIGSVLFPWPWPYHPGDPAAWEKPLFVLPGFPARIPRCGLYPCPVWDQLPAWMPHGSWLAGLAAGLAGLLAGMLPRAIGFLYQLGRRREGMGLGDADLMMMVGCFLGWQAVPAAFVLALPTGLILGIAELFRHGESKPFPFGPSLAIGSMAACLGWSWIGPHLLPYLYNGVMLVLVCVVGPILLLAASWLLYVVRGPAVEEDKAAT
jgi:leader peptidase (prepilin peptidase)/N-methyltransferase